MTRTKKDILEGCSKDVLKSRKVANNTIYIEYLDGTKAYRLHDTDIITIDLKGNYVLNSGGWMTVTTKDRINTFAPVRISQDNGVWYLDGGCVFYDGIVVNSDGKIISVLLKDPANEVKKMKRKIGKFCSLITKDNLPVPNAGDCWLCSLSDKDGNTMGEISKDYSHLESHIEENYLHGSLLVNAMREYGYKDEQIRLHYSMQLADTFKRAVRRYLQKRLIPTIQVK